MQKKKLKILFIPADNIAANISRSYYIAKGLSLFTDLYFLTWEDYRTIEWLGGKKNKINTFWCFINSLFQSTKIEQKNNEPFHRIKASVFIDALIGRLIGRVFTKKLMRRHNLKTLLKLQEKINPDVIFNADACYFFPINNSQETSHVIDIQDDVDWDLFQTSLQNYEKVYKKQQFQKADLFYIVSGSAKDSFIKTIGNFPFKVLFNGADFSEIQKDYKEEISYVRKKYNLESKIILTHIGSATWVDPIFTKKLFEEIYSIDKSIVLILVGSMAKIDAPNIINIGMVSAEESYVYYNLSDIGILLKNSINSDFLYNSVPLKNIQYAAAKKPVISFPIEWLEKENFNNTVILKNEETEQWYKAIIELHNNFKWTKVDDFQWKNYNWSFICENIYLDILKILHKNEN